jgi:uncharacterized protein (DUF488 family)
MAVFTLGHSTKPINDFIDKLRENNISLVIDIRSKPYSRWVPHFNKDRLNKSLNENGIEYLYRGKNLGGLEVNAGFDGAIRELIKLSESENLVLLCTEGDYKKCHRYLVVTPVLEQKGINVKHLIWEKTATKC